MVAKLTQTANGSQTPNDDLRDIIPAFPEPQTYPKGWDVSGIVLPLVSQQPVSKTKQVRPS